MTPLRAGALGSGLLGVVDAGFAATHATRVPSSGSRVDARECLHGTEPWCLLTVSTEICGKLRGVGGLVATFHTPKHPYVLKDVTRKCQCVDEGVRSRGALP